MPAHERGNSNSAASLVSVVLRFGKDKRARAVGLLLGTQAGRRRGGDTEKGALISPAFYLN